jgi:diamine N-acetyltransferase
MTDGVQIRPAVLADAADLVELATRIYYETFVAVNTPENMQAYLSQAFTLCQFEADLRDPRVAFHVAVADDRLIAYLKLVDRPAPECIQGELPVELERFYVDKRWHGTGVAAALMDTCLSEAQQRGFKTMYLGVWEHNDRAQAFYRKWGFTRVGEHIFQMGDDPQTDWWMARPI